MPKGRERELRKLIETLDALEAGGRMRSHDVDRWRAYYTKKLSADAIRRDRNWFWRNSRAGEDVSWFHKKVN